MRQKMPDRLLASALPTSVLPTPGTSSSSTCSPASRATRHKPDDFALAEHDPGDIGLEFGHDAPQLVGGRGDGHSAFSSAAATQSPCAGAWVQARRQQARPMRRDVRKADQREAQGFMFPGIRNARQAKRAASVRMAVDGDGSQAKYQRVKVGVS